jgi:hypothetical protein
LIQAPKIPIPGRRRLPGTTMRRTLLGRPPQRASIAAAVLAMALLLPGCAVKGLGFREDDRVKIVSPKNHSTLKLPVTVRWTTKDFRVTGPGGSPTDDAGYFAVFLDRSPQPPGETVEWLAKDDPTCFRSRGCPDAAWFTDHNIFPTTATSFTVDVLPTRTKEDLRTLHEVTVVLLDAAGRRIGESAFWVDFRVTGTRTT